VMGLHVLDVREHDFFIFFSFHFQNIHTYIHTYIHIYIFQN
jgi:hypothetical protein